MLQNDGPLANRLPEPASERVEDSLEVSHGPKAKTALGWNGVN